MKRHTREEERLSLQNRLDAAKSQAERNRLGQFATPAALAQEIVQFTLNLLDRDLPIRFLDPAFGTGAFYSALLNVVSHDRIESAKGFELDPHYAVPTDLLWQDSLLDLKLADFTREPAPSEEADRCNLLICNPPYVRHHHIPNGDKTLLQQATEAAFGARISGLAGLYCYFLGLSHLWMRQGGVAAWLVPSEFMDVNYGKEVKDYLLQKVTLLRIHRFDPNHVQFDDALVSSAILWFRNALPPVNFDVEFTYGGSLSAPTVARRIPVEALKREPKWTRFPMSGVREDKIVYRLSDFFTIKRGLATGANSFFILTKEQVETRHLPLEVFRPILPSPRYLPDDEIAADQEGLPVLERQLFLLDCRMPEAEVKDRFPKLWEYLGTGAGTVSQRYLARSRKVWYFQESRPPAPILCTYLGRTDAKGRQPFRFVLNHSEATATNVYLLLYPKPVLARAIARDPSLLRRIWDHLNSLRPSALLGEGRVYGGGLYKLEPKELGNVDATAIAALVPGFQKIRATQLPLMAQQGTA